MIMNKNNDDHKFFTSESLREHVETWLRPLFEEELPVRPNQVIIVGDCG